MFPNKLIMKTCGTTLNLLGLPRILSIAKEYAGLDSVYRCFYSRKSFMFPEYQTGPHKGGWTAEVGFLDDVFGQCLQLRFSPRSPRAKDKIKLTSTCIISLADNGSAYTVGPMNGDHWLLYVTSPRDQTPTPSVTPSASTSDTTHTPLLSSLANLLTPASSHAPAHSSDDHSSYASSSSVLADAVASAALHFPESSTTVQTHGSHSSGTVFPPAKNHSKVVKEGEQVERPLRLPSLGDLVRGGGPSSRGDDQTLEVLMTHLSARSRAQFYPPPVSTETLLAPGGDVLGTSISYVPASRSEASRLNAWFYVVVHVSFADNVTTSFSVRVRVIQQSFPPLLPFPHKPHHPRLLRLHPLRLLRQRPRPLSSPPFTFLHPDLCPRLFHRTRASIQRRLLDRPRHSRTRLLLRFLRIQHSLATLYHLARGRGGLPGSEDADWEGGGDL